MYTGGANFTSLLFMNVYRIYIFIICLSSPPLLMNWQKGGEEFWEFMYACVLLYLCIYVLFSLCTLLNIDIVYGYAWVKGELLWSLTLIHAYITPWVWSSSKKGRLLAQRPFTLVLMMINSCSYSLIIILWYLVSDIWSRY